MKKIWLFLFVLVSITELVSVTIGFPKVHTITKPLILPMLIAYLMAATELRNRYFFGAMVFCWAGDVLLMFSGEKFFIFGLVAFLTGHLLYVVSYRQMKNSYGDGFLSTQKLRFSFPIILAGTGLVVVLFPYLGGMKIPVMIYALVITVMALQALFRYGFTEKKSFYLVFVGALFFMLSDSLLAINKFMNPLPVASLLVMSTYILAQYLIAEGYIAHHRNTSRQ